MEGIYILLGTNLGDREANLEAARQYIQDQVGTIMHASPIYATAAWGLLEQPDFLNQVVQIHTTQPPETLLQTLLYIEEQMGRIRRVKWGERLIDLDILYYRNEVVDRPNLQVPHPGIAQRRFTLVPLADLAPDALHPTLGKTQTELLEACTDDSEVKRHSGN